MPIVTVSKTEDTPVNANDPALAERLRAVAVTALGADHVETAQSTMGSEDVGVFSLGNRIPELMYWLGASDPAKLAQSRQTGVALPGLHTALFAPDYEPAIRTGVTAMTAMALDLMK